MQKLVDLMIYKCRGQQIQLMKLQRMAVSVKCNCETFHHKYIRNSSFDRVSWKLLWRKKILGQLGKLVFNTKPLKKLLNVNPMNWARTSITAKQ